ncbi:MAG: glycosyltransferase family 4 protein [Chloroflexi bacterium]|nr:glycosyltransferase family 4 protein [Chloroflexota bacterium]
MRLGLSGHFLDQPTTGSGQYLANLLRELTPRWGGEIVVFVPTSRSTTAAASALAPGSRVRVVPLATPPGARLGKLWFEQVGIPWAARRLRLNLLHIPYLGPPLAAPCPLVVTVHDVMPLVLPELRAAPHARVYAALAAAAARRADLVLTVSYYARSDILRRLGLPPERVQTIYEAAEERFRPLPPDEVRHALHQRYRLEPGYVYYMGGLDRRKNVDTLIRAYARLEGAPPLVIAGQARSGNRAHFPDLPAVAREVGAAERVRFLGWVSEEDKPLLYNGAGLFVFPSRYEGFGLTPLEALACGAPVLCSSATSLPEVVGGAAPLFDPDDTDGLARLLAQTLSDSALRARLREAGPAWARRFSWARTATETVAAYYDLLFDHDEETFRA